MFRGALLPYTVNVDLSGSFVYNLGARNSANAGLAESGCCFFINQMTLCPCKGFRLEEGGKPATSSLLSPQRTK
jgi:hypothetical protein